MGLINRIKALLNRGHERSVRAKKNVLLALLFKGTGVFIGFLYFPITLSYLSPVKFGIFITLTSMLDWFADFDMGISEGLRNKLGESLADEDYDEARGYVSTAFFTLGAIFTVIAILGIISSFFIPWAAWLNAEESLNRDIFILAVFILIAFCIRFVASLVYQVFYAVQKVAIVDMLSLITKVLFLGVILLLLYFTDESLILFGAAKTMTFALVPLGAAIYYLNREFSYLKPSLRLVKRRFFDSLFSLGLQFFLIRLSLIVIYQTNYFLIARFASLEEVPQYEAAYKYLSIFLMLFVILTNQLWGANIEAYRKGEYDWMRKTVKNVLKIWMLTIVLTVIMVLVSPYFYQLWLQGRLEIPLALTAAVALSVSMTNWVNLFNLVINGTGKIRLQMYAWLGASIVNIPLSIFFATTLGLGTIGIVFGTIVSMIPLAIISPLQVRKLLRQTDTGIWSK